MKKLAIGILAAGLFCGAAGIAATDAKAPKAPKVSPDKMDWSFLPAVVAEIDGKKITRAEFVKEIEKQLAAAPGGMKIPPQYMKMMAGKMVSGYIDKMILMDLVEKAGFKPSAAMAIKAMKANLTKMSPAELQRIKQQIAMSGSTIDEEIAKQAKSTQVQDSVAIGTWIDEVIVPKCKVTVAEAKEYYKKNPKQFTPPVDPADSYRSSHILVTVPKGADKAAWDAAEKKIDDLYKRLKSGEKFEDLALKYSACPSGKRSNGSLGVAKKGNMVPEFEKAALALKPGETTKVKTQFGWHIVRRDESVTKATIMPFAKVEKQLIDGLQAKKEKEMLAKIMAKAKADRKVKILVKTAPMMMPGMMPAPTSKAKPAAKKACDAKSSCCSSKLNSSCDSKKSDKK